MAPARGIDESFIGHRRSFRQGQAFFVHAKLVACALAAVARLVRSRAFIKKIEPAICEERRMIVVQTVFNVFFFSPTRRHHFDLAAEFVLPQLVPRCEIQHMNDRLSFECVTQRSLRIPGHDDREQIFFRFDRDVHDRAAQFLALPNAVAAERIDRFEARARSFLEAHQDHVSPGNRRHIVFVQR